MSTEENDPEIILERLEEKDAIILLPDILGHPEELPTYKELDFLNPEFDSQKLMEALARLEEEGVLRVVTIPEDEREDDLPHEFYTLTIRGRLIADYIGLMDEADEIKDALATLNFPDDVARFRDAPRPDRS